MKGVVEGLRADMMRLQGVDDVEPPPVDEFLAEVAHHGEMPLDAFRGEHVRHVAYRVGTARLYEVLCVEEEHDLGRLGGCRGKRRRQQDRSQNVRMYFHIQPPGRRLPIWRAAILAAHGDYGLTHHWNRMTVPTGGR